MAAGSSSPMAGRCGATLRRKPGRFCTAYPLTGKTRCALHGGKSLAGPANGNWKHGMYSTVLHGALGTHYATARQNPALVALTEQIALVDAKVFELFEQVQQGESPAAWTRVLELAAAQEAALEAFATARRSANGPAMSQALRALTEAVATLGTVARQGAEQGKAWGVISDQLHLRRRLVDSEVRRQKAAHDTLTQDRALAMLAYIAQSVARHVTDPTAKQAVVDDMRKLIGPVSEVGTG